MTVIAVPHPKWVERPLACVVPKPGEHVTPAEIVEFLRPKLARWALPEKTAMSRTRQACHAARTAAAREVPARVRLPRLGP